jgi:hypothetical protein
MQIIGITLGCVYMALVVRAFCLLAIRKPDKAVPLLILAISSQGVAIALRTVRDLDITMGVAALAGASFMLGMALIQVARK